MTPGQECQIYDGNDELKVVKVVTLGLWNVALKHAAQGHDVHNVVPIVRKFLGVSDDYPVEEMYHHINTSYTDVMAQLREAGLVN